MEDECDPVCSENGGTTRILTVELHCGRTGKAEESRGWGTASTDAAAFKGKNGELRNANRPDSYHTCFPTTVRADKEEHALFSEL